MVFNSIAFLFFCAVVFPLYYLFPFRWQNYLLLAASYFFYGWWDWRFTLLLFSTTAIDYWVARQIGRSNEPVVRKRFLTISIVANLTALGTFKYFNFFSHTLQTSLHGIGLSADWPTLNIILPVGISFYTFLSMSYTIDVYRREIQPACHFSDFALFVSYFPHLVAGPIMRASNLLPQCAHPRLIKPDEVVNGLWMLLTGFIKKIVIADHLAKIADSGFGGQTPPVADANAWWFVLAFAFQIYGDFSGYSDIARGLAKVMGFELMENFRAPYLVTGPSEFWKNWHISLSTWLRDYLYIPLGGNRHGPFKTYRNLMVTMVLGGLWHGAGLAYLAWGFYHGTLLCLQRARHHFFGDRTGARRVLVGVQVAGFFGLTCVGWLIFRAGSCPPGVRSDLLMWSFLRAMVTPPSSLLPAAWTVILLGAMALAFQITHQKMNRFDDWSPPWQAMGIGGALALLCLLGVFEGSQFIYFQF
jgi:D-alanyl-lipoteichoic acid acyltransferase DltB (MBOAT superfamily)